MTRLRSFAAVMTISGATLLAQPPTAESTTLGRQTLSETTDPKMSLFFLNLAPGAIVPSHSHAGAVFAYVLQGDIENQIELEPPAVYHPGGFFEERPMQVHRMLR